MKTVAVLFLLASVAGNAAVAAAANSTASEAAPKCDPVSSCGDDYAPMCASDGVVYMSKCEILIAKCRAPKKKLMVAKQHVAHLACAKDTFVKCLKPAACGDWEVCGSDGRTYASNCALQKARCLKRNAVLTSIYRGRCKIERVK